MKFARFFRLTTLSMLLSAAACATAPPVPSNLPTPPDEPAGVQSCPVFGYQAEEAHISHGGPAELICNVSAQGVASSCQVLSGIAGIDDERLIDYAQRCTFFPARRSGTTTPSPDVAFQLTVAAPDLRASAALGPQPVAPPPALGRLRNCKPLVYDDLDILFDAGDSGVLRCDVAAGKVLSCRNVHSIQGLARPHLMKFLEGCEIEPATPGTVELRLELPHAATTDDQKRTAERLLKNLEVQIRPGYKPPRLVDGRPLQIFHGVSEVRGKSTLVVALCTIHTDGTMDDCVVAIDPMHVASSANGYFMSGLRFAPATLKGEPVELPGQLVPWLVYFW